MAKDKIRKKTTASEPRKAQKSIRTIIIQQSVESTNANTPNAATSEILRDQKITPVLSGLKSTNPVDRVQHLVAASKLVEDPACRQLLLKENLVKIVQEETLKDENPEVVQNGWKLLWKLVEYQGYDVAVHLYRRDILKQIEGAIENINRSLEALEANPKALTPQLQAILWDSCHGVTSFLTALSEFTQDIAEELSSPGLLQFISKFIIPETKAPASVQKAASLFLSRITDENEKAYNLISKDQSIVHLLKRLNSIQNDDPQELLRTASISSILYNLINTSRSKKDTFLEESGISDVEVAAASNSIVETISKKSSLTDEDTHALLLALQTLTHITGQASAIFTKSAKAQSGVINGNKSDDDDEMDEDEELNSEDEVMDEDEEEASDSDSNADSLPSDFEEDLEKVTGEEGTITKSKQPKPLPSPILESILSTTIPTIQPLISSSATSHTQSLHQIFSLNLITSIFNSTNEIQSSKLKSKYTLPEPFLQSLITKSQELWQSTITPIITSNTANIPLAESITNLSSQITTYNKTLPQDQNQHKSFIALFYAINSQPSTSSSSETKSTIQSLKIQCIKVLSNLAQLPPQETPFSQEYITTKTQINQEIGIFLIQLISTLPSENPKSGLENPEPKVIIEALNSIYDVYSDGSFFYDGSVFVKLGFLKYLKSFIGPVRALAKSIDKRKNFDLRERADEAFMNLNAFIRYKTKEQE